MDQPGPSTSRAQGNAVQPPALQRSASSTVGPAVVHRPTANNIVVSNRQHGNPLLAHIRNVGWEYADIPCDYQVGVTTGVLYLSIKYHRLHPEYIHNRIANLQKAYNLRIIMLMVDVDDHKEVIKELTKVALVNEFTLMLAWSNQEAARYLEIYKKWEKKSADLIKERKETSYLSQAESVLGTVRGVNKTDATTLLTNFGSLKRIVAASPEELQACPGLGDKKVARLRDAFSSPFAIRRKVTSQAEKNAAVGNALN